MKEAEYERMYQFEDDYWWYRGLHDLVQRLCMKYYPSYKKRKNIRILDAGCGTGRLMQLLGSDYSVRGFDISANAINYGKKRGLSDIWQQDINNLEERDEYDIIVSLDVICSFGVEDDELILEKFNKALKPGGLILLNLPAFCILKRDHDTAVNIKKRYRTKDLKTRLKQTGFRKLILTYRLPPLFIYILLRKIFIKEHIDRELVSDLKPLPGFINNILYKYNKLENLLISKKLFFPFGSSLFVLAEKNPC